MKPAEFERQWKRKLGKTSKNPNAVDLWTRLEEARQQVKVSQEKPPDAFTVREYTEKYGVSYDVARGQIRKLIKAGKIRSAGHIGPNTNFYVMA